MMATSAFLFLSLLLSSQATIAVADDTFFETKIRPILVEHCYSCHSLESGEASGELLLDSAASMKRGGGRGTPLNLNMPEESLLIRVLTHADENLKMPPEEKLPDSVVDDFRTWLKQGAPDPRGGTVPDKSARELLAEKHWAYQLPQPYQLVEAAGVEHANDPIDIAILEKLREKGLEPAAKADKFTLVRRLSYDLLGLPPSPEDIAALQSDDSPDAYRRVVERLLASPQFGERWARHWMDVARYADTKGYVFQEDRNYAAAFRYRDWLIRSLNEDMPYDQFVQYQLAADALDPKNEQGHLDAMGFLTLGRRFLNNIHDIIDDRMDVVGRGLMGLTIACARCHDHKYDPVSAADYYSMYGIFLNSDEPGGDPSPLRLVDSPNEKPAFIFLRGQAHNRGEQVPRRFVKFLSEENSANFTAGSGRLDLAKSIISAKNPLTARVIVNRVWLRLVGSNLIDTPSDLGIRAPQPELLDVLDELSCGMIENQWSLKHLIRRIVLSSTYQQSSLGRDELAQKQDPENRLLWRMNRKRVDFEGLRDSILVSTGRLDPRLGGPSVPIHEPPYTNRRTVYSFIDRQNLPGIFRSFDVASPDAHNPQRSLTTVPQQGLFLLNSDWIAEQAQALGDQLTNEFGVSNDEALVRAAFTKILKRSPNDLELKMGIDYLANARQSSAHGPTPIWSYGYGSFSPETGELKSFTKFPAFDGGTYRGEKPLPDDKLGWASLSAEGGHPGTKDFSVVRRWQAPQAGMLQIIGQAEHGTDQGNGVVAAIVVDQKNLLGKWEVRNGKVEIKTEAFDIPAGTTVDLIVCDNGDTSHDSFKWRAVVRITGETKETYASNKGFGPPPAQPMDAVDLLVQALLGSNELAFVD